MKLKKVMAILTVMAVSAGMAAPQTALPLGTVTAYAEEVNPEDETEISEETDSAEETDDLESADMQTESEAAAETAVQTETADAAETDGETADAAVTQVTTEAELTAALAAASTDAENPTVIELQNDISCTAYLNIASGTYVEIRSAEGQQYTLLATGAAADYRNGRYVSGLLYVGGSLVLENVICDANQIDRCAYVPAGATLELGNGAVLTNGKPTYASRQVYNDGGGAYVLGTLIMDKGSAVRNNTVDLSTRGSLPNGIGVYIGNDAEFIMYGGAISGNSYVYDTCGVQGGGVYLGNYASFYMYGGTIADNEISGRGAGVFTEGYCTVVLGKTDDTEIPDGVQCDEKAVIRDNVIYDDITSSNYKPQGAGVYLAAGSDMTIQASDDENTVISGNTVYTSCYEMPETVGSGIPQPADRGCGGGLFVLGDVTMTGGSITENRAVGTEAPGENEEDPDQYHYASGAGVYLQTGSFTMTGGQISGNTASAAWTDNTFAGVGGGVCVGFSASTTSQTVPAFTMTGGSITGNTAAEGSDVYLADCMPVYDSDAISGDSGTQVLIGASPILRMGDAAKIGSVYLPAELEEGYNGTDGKAVIRLTSPLTTASGVEVENPEVGTVIAEGDGYVPRYTDEESLTYAGSADLEVRLDGNNQLSLQEKTGERTSLEAAVVTFSEDQELVYTGEGLTPEPTVTLGDQVLEKGVDYALSYSDNTDVGTAAVVISGIGSYTGSQEAEFEILPREISDAEVTVDAIGDQIWNGSAATPGVTVRFGDQVLAAGNADSEEAYDYSVSYANNEEPGTAVVTITGHGNFTGVREVTFNIVDPDGTVVSSWDDLKQAVEAAADTTAENPLVISLAADLTTDSAEAGDGMITLPENTFVEIVGYGHTITAENGVFASAEQSETGMFVVSSGSNLELRGLTLDGAYQERLLYVKAGGSADVAADVTLTRGRATDLTGTANPAAIGGQAVWNAGEITFAGSLENNITASNYYGAIYNAGGGKFIMTETGRIADVQVFSYGTVYNEGEFTMDGGVITGTSRMANAAFAQAKAVYNVGTFIMKEGSAITENEGTGSTVYNSGSFQMKGGEISDNINSDATGNSEGTVYMAGGSFTMTGGSISGNQVITKGGGICIAGGVVTIDGADAKITDNQAVNNTSLPSANTSVGGGIYMYGGELNLLQGSVDNNEAYYCGQVASEKQSRLNLVSCKNGVLSLETAQGNERDETCYGLGGGIFVDSGTLNLGDGAVVSGNYSPLEYASGIFVAEDRIREVEETASQISLGGNAQVTDAIWLDSGKSIQITEALGADVSYTVYQQERDFRLAENGGNPAAVYKDDSIVNWENDGAKFDVYSYDPEFDFEADASLDHYSVLSKEESGSGTAGIYANFPEVNVADMIYVFANAYGKDEETGTYLYRYNGRSQTPTIRATARVASSGGDGTEEGGTTDINATNDLIFEVAENDGSAGDVSVKVTSNSYHYTGETELTFRIVPFDLSDQDAGNRWEAEFTVENAEYSSDNPAGTTYEPAVTGRVRLGVVNWSNLVQADDETSEGDFVVTYENNDRVGEATAVITGVNNYTGTVRVNFQIEKTDEVARGADGNWYYYKNGVVQSDYTGFQENSNGWWYIEGGKVTFAKNDVIHGTVNGQDGW